MTLVKIIVFIIAVILGIIILRKTEPLVRLFGKNEWAEEHLGGGGTYTMWKIIGLLVIIAGLIYMVGLPR